MFLRICIAAALSTGAALGTHRERLVNQVEEQCSVKNKDEYHKEFLENYGVNGGDQDKALRTAKKYLACPVGPHDSEETLASLNFAVGRMLRLKNSHVESIPYLIKAASYNSPVQISAKTYAELADAYEQGLYAEQLAPYKAKFAGKDETDESKLALENINEHPTLAKMTSGLTLLRRSKAICYSPKLEFSKNQLNLRGHMASLSEERNPTWEAMTIGGIAVTISLLV